MKKRYDLSTTEWINRAYKKLKNHLYFDKTQLPLMDDLVSFESDGIEDHIHEITVALESTDDIWKRFSASIIQKIDTFIYPKKLHSYSAGQVIFNTDSEPIKMESAKYFIDLPVAGHILGTLWVLIIGAYLDNRNETEETLMYEHSYGNRLKKNLYHPESREITYSPYLFEPYFSQYENWRDTALTQAKERLDSSQDALILTLDLRNFFYSVHISEQNFFDIYNQYKNSERNFPTWTKRIHDFVYDVLKAYSQKICLVNTDPALSLGQRTFLPIGFLPSYVLSNWILTPFDKTISERINPVYYGRYVDDIILVDKVEKNSLLYKKARGTSDGQDKLTDKDVIEYYFGPSRNLDENVTINSPENAQEHLGKNRMNHPNMFHGSDNQAPYRAGIQAQIFMQIRETDQTLHQKNQDGFPPVCYRIDPKILDMDGEVVPDIQVQNDKVKIFYFRKGSTQALLDCFRNEIGRNASEFRYLPEIDHALYKNDYSEIFKLVNSETPHKLRGVSNVTLDKFSLSKFLGKYRKVGNLIRDRQENTFDKDLLTILSKRELIDNYPMWERLLEILIVNDRLDYYEELIKHILEAIAAYEVSANLCSEESLPRRGLYRTLRAAVCRTSALCWGTKVDEKLSIVQSFGEGGESSEASLFYRYDLNKHRKNYCLCHMVNKYVLSLPIGWLKQGIFQAESGFINLCHLKSFCAWADWDAAEKPYAYFPYMVTPHEISYALTCKNMALGEKLANPQEQIDKIRKLYQLWNYCIKDYDSKFFPLTSVNAKPIKCEPVIKKNCHVIRVESTAPSKIKVAIGNARLYEEDFINVLTGKPNRSYERYRQVSKLLGAAISEQTDLLVLPENFLPWEWLPDILRFCANNQIALITGLEHIVSDPLKDNQGKDIPQKVYNLTAVILPYKEGDYQFAHVVYHHKVHYSPNEKRMIHGYRMDPYAGDKYQLFCWRGLWFSVYCCYELASIQDRALFQSFADLIVAVEWNRDIPYFGSIIESLCRDLHCYCIQVNSSNYGDSRVMLPTENIRRDLIKTKGGCNRTILTDYIDFVSLRKFQCKEYELQRDDRTFKPTPPKFEPTIPERKQNGTLWEYLTGDSSK